MKIAWRSPRNTEKDENGKQQAQLFYAQTFLQYDLWRGYYQPPVLLRFGSHFEGFIDKITIKCNHNDVDNGTILS